MNTEKKILRLFEELNIPLPVGEIAIRVDKTRPYVSSVLKKMLDAGLVENRRDGKNILYSKKQKDTVLLDVMLSNDHLNESDVYFRVDRNREFYDGVSESARAVFSYAFQEILNNAIEHSESDRIWVKVSKSEEKLKYIIRDFGIGIYRNVKNKYGLQSDYDAALEILKGKNTTMPDEHTGMGVFFSSQIADRIEIKSFGLAFVRENILGEPDVTLLEDGKEVNGTEVQFEISTNSSKSVTRIFQNFSIDKEEGGFDRTEITIKLYQKNIAFVSRSQARMLLVGLDKFKKVTLDFRGVDNIGQAFADEIFRVYKVRHPEVEFECVNANRAVRFMIELAESGERML
ncbi:DUF4325 domain-containing protein [Candidatus Saccharibacteria bacterium]|nr:DUF4325 domain-containing protein [Candidatus Saccharibacteria bacterium]